MVQLSHPDMTTGKIIALTIWTFVRRASLVAQMLKNLPATWETQVQPLGWKDPLKKTMATHSSILA